MKSLKFIIGIIIAFVAIFASCKITTTTNYYYSDTKSQVTADSTSCPINCDSKAHKRHNKRK